MAACPKCMSLAIWLLLVVECKGSESFPHLVNQIHRLDIPEMHQTLRLRRLRWSFVLRLIYYIFLYVNIVLWFIFVCHVEHFFSYLLISILIFFLFSLFLSFFLFCIFAIENFNLFHAGISRQATGWTAEGSEFESPYGHNFSYQRNPDNLWSLPSLLSNGYWRIFSLE
jgi:hypothetical protein